MILERIVTPGRFFAAAEIEADAESCGPRTQHDGRWCRSSSALRNTRSNSRRSSMLKALSFSADSS